MSDENKNDTLHRAKVAKEDEFYTTYEAVEAELCHYTQHFAGKIVYLNCDDYRQSNFWVYFKKHFAEFGLKLLVASNYDIGEGAFLASFDGKNEKHVSLNGHGDGDFRSEKCLSVMRQSDIVITNPPFSFFREMLQTLLDENKKFIILGTHNCCGYGDVFPHIRENRIWLGWTNGQMEFRVPQSYEPRKTRYWQDENGQKWRSLGNTCWFTNLEHNKRNEYIPLTTKFDPTIHEKYDNHDAVNANKVSDIPCDYDGIVGVPITFLNRFNPKQFEIVGFRKGYDGKDLRIDGKEMFSRVLIKRQYERES